jgi:hypothetical protein
LIFAFNCGFGLKKNAVKSVFFAVNCCFERKKMKAPNIDFRLQLLLWAKEILPSVALSQEKLL